LRHGWRRYDASAMREILTAGHDVFDLTDQ
jgi:hypothetical protein